MSAVCSAARSVGEWAARYRATAMRMCRPSSVFAPDGELPDSRLQHLVGMKARIFPQHCMRKRGDQRLRRMAELEMPRHEPGRKIDLSLAVEGVEQGDPDRLLIGRQIVELLVALAWNAGRRHIEVASEIESHRTVQDSPRTARGDRWRRAPIRPSIWQSALA